MDWGFLFDPKGKVEKVISRWKPQDCKTEKDFERSLLNELRLRMPDVNVQSQYGDARQRIDIVVGGKVAIELKRDMKNTSVYQRTIGQLESLFQKWDFGFLVVCRKIEPDLLKGLKQYVRRRFDEEDFSIIVKE